MIYETIAAKRARLKKLGADDPRTRRTAGQTSGRDAGSGSATFGTAGGSARVIEAFQRLGMTAEQAEEVLTFLRHKP